jgi:hypothetical protein
MELMTVNGPQWYRVQRRTDTVNRILDRG